jgi:glycosyltransferase involved in cell wall biosynthesis
VFIPTGTSLNAPVPPAHLGAIGIEPGKYFLSAVRLVREKGLHYLIPAFRKAGCQWKLVVAGGDGGDTKYSRHLRELATGCDRICFLGHVKEPLLGELFSNAGAYVQASEIEGMSISLLDAMSHGRCCIVSNIPENLDALNGAGISFRSADCDDLAHKLKWVELSHQTAAEMGEKARDQVLKSFSWDAATDNLEAFYRETVTRAAPHTQPARSVVELHGTGD